MDYTRFLGKSDERVLPWFGGANVEAKGRSLRLKTRPAAPGWWTFAVEGRHASPLSPAEPPADLDLPTVRGHLLGAQLVAEDGGLETVHFLPADEPALFAPLTARRWHSGELLSDQLEFESEAEEAARQALEEGRSLQGIKAVPSSLRAAYAYALIEQQARAADIPASPLEVRGAIGALADGGPAAAVAELQRLQQRRRTQRVLEAVAAAGALTRVEDERAATALASAGARLLRLRRLAGGQLEATYLFLGTRFQSIVDAETLQVVDAGVCLAGEDGLVTLESLPGVIREAVEGGELVITRRVDGEL